MNGVVNIAGFKKEIARSVNNRLFRQQLRHLPRRHLPNAGADMVILTDMTAGSERQLGCPQLLFAVDLGQNPPERRFEFYLRHQALGVHLDRTARLLQRVARWRHQRQERLGGKAVWLGRSSLLEATRRGQVRLEGTPADLRALPTWFDGCGGANVRRGLANHGAAGDRKQETRLEAARSEAPQAALILKLRSARQGAPPRP